MFCFTIIYVRFGIPRLRSIFEEFQTTVRAFLNHHRNIQTQHDLALWNQYRPCIGSKHQQQGGCSPFPRGDVLSLIYLYRDTAIFCRSVSMSVNKIDLFTSRYHVCFTAERSGAESRQILFTSNNRLSTVSTSFVEKHCVP